jgi:hypothetical protein
METSREYGLTNNHDYLLHRLLEVYIAELRAAMVLAA